MIRVNNKALALGSFDGLHKGHLAVLSSAKTHSERTAVVFDIPPAMTGGQRELLLSVDQKHTILNEMGFTVETLDFAAVKNIEPIAFLETLKEKYSPAKICCGFNYRFGKNGSGTQEILKEFCLQNGIELSVTPEVVLSGDRISSSRIRSIIKTGDMETAALLLGRDFSLRGTVTHGDMRGRTINFPTANFPYPEDLVMAKHGVYAATCFIAGEEYKAVCYVGNRPSYALPTPIVETYIIDFSGDLYGKELKVNLKKYLRDEIRFDSLSELKNQLKKDIISAK